MSLSDTILAYILLPSTDVEASTIPQDLALQIEKKEIKLLDVVLGLGEQLQSEDDRTRERAKVLTTFLSSKLSDSPCLTPAIKSLTHLSSLETFGTGEGVEVATAIIDLPPLSSHSQPTRHLVYTLLDSLLHHSRPALKRLGAKFLKGYAALVDGEKDPRNLMLSFGILRVVLVEFELEDCVEDLFDITFCYFPITFSPPAGDPYGITSDDLVVALRACLAATPLFGKLALPLFLDKMQAASEKAKRQTMQALAACFPVYGAGVVGEWAGRFSEALSIEVFHATDDDSLALALTTFTSLYSTLYPDSSPEKPTDDSMDVDSEGKTGKEIEGVAVKLVNNCLDELREPDKSNAGAAVKIVVALMKSSDRLKEYALDKSLNLLMGIMKDPEEIALRPSVIGHFSALLAALSDTPSIPNPLEAHKDSLLTLLTSSTRATTTSQLPALEALIHLLLVPTFLSPQEIGFAVDGLNDVLRRGQEGYEEAVEGVVRLSNASSPSSATFERTIEETTLPILFAALPEKAPERGTNESEEYRKALGSLAEICATKGRGLAEVFVRRLGGRVEGVCAAKVQGAEAAEQALYAHHLLATIKAVLAVKATRGDADVVDYEPIQSELSEALKKAFFEGDAVALVGAESTPAHQSLLLLLSSAILSFRVSVNPISLPMMKKFLELSVVPGEEGEGLRKAVRWMLGQTVNKGLEGLKSFVEADMEKFWLESVANVEQGADVRKSALWTWAWFAKGLVVRSEQRGYASVERIIGLFHDPVLGREAAKVLGVIAEEGDRVLSKENFAVVRLLYKQRFFSFLLPKLVTGHKESEKDDQVVYLIALSSLLQHIPKAMSLVELPKLLPLLITSLDLPDPGLRANVVQTLGVLAKEVPTELENSISGIVTKVLRGLTEDKVGRGSVKLRVASLSFLEVLPKHIPYLTLHSQKPIVLKELGKSLDDKKKEVRKAAVGCRSQWFMYSA
ncbi:DNA repair/transcription protein [Pseudohyphozyma bogoriensis]|nr:DNA repair/transcription protein [Pseudohyphozyma bogoriensis]